MTNSSQQYTFMQRTEHNPCEGCPAPCCEMQLHTCIPPETLMHLDHIRYSLLFPNKELAISKDGNFSWIEWKRCTLFDEKKCTCTVHNTPKKPLICVHFNPHNCWYKRNFVTETPKDLCRLNLERFEKWVEEIKLDENDKITNVPSFEKTVEIIEKIKISPIFQSNSTLKKTSPATLQNNI